MIQKRKKQSLTLLEIMIVIFLIGLIGSVIGYNMKGSLEEGKAFKTERAQEQVYDILMLEVAQGAPIDEVIKNPESYLNHSGIAKKPKSLLKDGWNNLFEITAKGQNIVVRSEALKSYRARKKAKINNSKQVEEIVQNEDSEE